MNQTLVSSKGWKNIVSVVFTVLLSVLLVVTVVQAATTISTNIETAGTLTITGTGTSTLATGGVQVLRILTDSVEATSTSAFSRFAGGLLSQASSTVSGAFTVSGHSALTTASTTILSTTGNFLVNGYATTTASNGTFTVAGPIYASSTLQASGVATFYGNATTSQLTVGGGTTLNNIVSGYCTIPATTITASSSASAVCTTQSGAIPLLTTSLVFVNATGSLPTNFIITSASSTAATTIAVQIFNTGHIAGTDTGVNSFNFWAFR